MPAAYEDPQTLPSKGANKDSVTTHPAFAQIKADRVNGDMLLYGSDFRHHNHIRITIARSELHRGLSRDWHFNREEVVEVALSEAQWATFISTMNCGGGTPCTLQHIQRQAIPQIPYHPNRQEQFSGDFKERLSVAQKALAELQQQIAATNLSGKAKEALIRQVEKATMNIDCNLDFVTKQFGEHMETVAEHAKIEVEAYTQATIQRAGLAAIASGAPIAFGRALPEALPQEAADDQ